MAKPSVRALVRDLLTAHPALTNAEVVQKAMAAGAKGTKDAVLHSVHNVRTELRKVGIVPAAASAPVKIPAPAKSAPVKLPSAQAAKSAPVEIAAPAAARSTTPPASGLAAVLANVAEVNAVVVACGGVGNARRAAEAVRACGGADAFLDCLGLVEGILGAKT